MKALLLTCVTLLAVALYGCRSDIETIRNLQTDQQPEQAGS